jgi:hypothetical protein
MRRAAVPHGRITDEDARTSRSEGLAMVVASDFHSALANCC